MILCFLSVFPQVTLAAVYPTEISETIEDGYYKTTKTYALSDDEDPEEIPKEIFKKDGIRYTFSDLLQKEVKTDKKCVQNKIVENKVTNKLDDIKSQIKADHKKVYTKTDRTFDDDGMSL